MDIELLKSASELPWRKLDVGLEQTVAGEDLVYANYVYIESFVPFLLVAESFDLDSGQELFGIKLITSKEVIKEYMDGPYPPFNKLKAVSLSDIVSRETDGFMNNKKHLLINRKLVSIKECGNIFPMIIEDMIFEGNGLKIEIRASCSIPMSLEFTWLEP